MYTYIYIYTYIYAIMTCMTCIQYLTSVQTQFYRPLTTQPLIEKTKVVRLYDNTSEQCLCPTCQS